jgi:hypothetical protein
MKPSELKLFYEPKDRLRLTVNEDRSYHSVKAVWAAPLSHPENYLSLMNGKGEEIVTVTNPNDLDNESLVAVREELRRRYLTATVSDILSAKFEYGATYWHVESDRGPREFVTQHLQENAIWLSDDHLLLLDVDGNRFEIPNVSALNIRSRAFISSIL